MGPWEEDHRGESITITSHKGVCCQPDITVDVALGHLAEVRVLHSKATLSCPFFLYCTLEKKGTMCSPH